ncbi:HlyD family efflux transporter periplasmic adaptor subunit [Salmonella enterica]|nr:HlyD family efflux transporter periplasmic adaptor subunit [Salmonella enterica]EAS9892338.1 HlyD family efflux transporter periplasmic adaptor subunit [Salmonella enterica]EEG2847075.1 HlyD family efflux transporter periplasmic adaptor subunit [Salmonella enterica]EEH1292840.1 HlyD family efflux transporter periplasmic adaptor subunit [Salmonella enterica]
MDKMKRHLVWWGAGILVAVAAIAWWMLRPAGIPEGFAASNGRIEATEVDIATKIAGRIVADIDDSELKAPRDGRVQYRVAEPGEVLSAGGRVLNMVDLSDVYMTFFLPTEQAGLLKIGGDARLVLDAAPDLRIPATISFVASVAQFTPKTVETHDERLKLMFRVKARIPPELLRQHLEYVKTGLPGMAWVRLDERVPWPDALSVRLSQ